MKANRVINSFIFKISIPKCWTYNEEGIKLPSPLHDLKQKITALMKITGQRYIKETHLVPKHRTTSDILQCSSAGFISTDGNASWNISNKTVSSINFVKITKTIWFVFVSSDWIIDKKQQSSWQSKKTSITLTVQCRKAVESYLPIKNSILKSRPTFNFRTTAWCLLHTNGFYLKITQIPVHVK